MRNKLENRSITKFAPTQATMRKKVISRQLDERICALHYVLHYTYKLNRPSDGNHHMIDSAMDHLLEGSNDPVKLLQESRT
jgi:hypothetical protein